MTGDKQLPMLPQVLYVTDLSYEAKGRVYRDEDLFVTEQLRPYFDLVLCHPLQVESKMAGFDAVVVRNSGPVLHYQKQYESFRAAALSSGTRVFNQLSGRADMIGKQYLVDLSAAGAAVIPTADQSADLGRLPAASSFVVKPKLGSDSIGMRLVDCRGLALLDFEGILVQPAIEFEYEVSFYYVDRDFQYALYAPDPNRRWQLSRYEPTLQDLAFADWFVDWNTIDHGIQRVDACRAREGDLLLMELEDLNPYLSLDLVDGDTRDRFIAAMRRSIVELIRT